jgi:transposase
MSTDVPSSGDFSRPLKVTAIPAPGRVAIPVSDPFTAAIQVPVAQVPITELLEEPAKDGAAPTVPIKDGAAPTASPSSKAPSGKSASSKEVAALVDALAALLRAFPASAINVNLAALPDDPSVLQRMIIELLQALRRQGRDLDETRRRLDALLRPRATPVNPDQPSLFPEAEAASATPPTPAPVAEEPVSRRGQCKPHGRRRPSRELRREPKRHELTAAERACPDCGQERREIGVETTDQYDYKPAEVFVIEHQQVKYACKCCEGRVILAPKPPQPIDKGLPGPGLLAQITTDKYLDHIPLHRSEQRFARLGVDLPRSTMCDWMAACAELLTPLYLLLKVHVLQSKVLHTDDTTVPVRDEKLSKHRYGRLWDYIGDAEHPGVVFDYTTTHARDGPAAFLKNFRGALQADAYSVYDGIYLGSHGAIKEVGCWAHARNKFSDAQSTDPERVLAAKAWVRRLYDVEDEAKKLSSAERLRLRQEKSVPLLESFCQWLLAQKAQVLPKSPIAAAINYALNQWEALTRYTTDGDLHIDNNVSERTLKLIGMGRGNWLFVGSDAGGRTAAVLFSFTATCKLLGIDPFAYLRDVLGRLPTHPAERLEELLPHHWKAAQAAPANGASITTPT